MYYGVFMFAKKLSIITCCFAALLNISSYASSATTTKPLVKFTPLGDCDSPSHAEPMEKFTLEAPKGKVPPQIFRRFMEIYIMHPLAVEDFMRSLSSPESISPHSQLIIPPEEHHEMEAAVALNPTIEQLQASIEAIDETLAFISNPTQLLGLTDLPKTNKIILLDLASTLVEEGKPEFSTLRDTLQDQMEPDPTTSFDSSADVINWGLQTGQNYKRYTEEGCTEYLQSLVNCFIFSKGQEMQGFLPTITVETLEILVRSAIDHSGYAGHSSQILDLFRKFKTYAKF